MKDEKISLTQLGSRRIIILPEEQIKNSISELSSAEEQIKSMDEFLKEFKPKIKTSSDRVWYNLLSRSLDYNKAFLKLIYTLIK